MQGSVGQAEGHRNGLKMAECLAVLNTHGGKSGEYME
jgi:hypothetical protein